MTQQETAKLIAKMKAFFPASFAKKTVEETKKDIASWYPLYKDFPAEVVFSALDEYAMTHDTAFAPAPGQLYAVILKHTKNDSELLDKYDAWELVEKAIHNGIDDSKKEYDKLPPAVQRAVGSSSHIREWGMMDVDKMSWIKNDFLSRYQEIYEAEEERLRLPSTTVMLLGKGQKRLPV